MSEQTNITNTTMTDEQINTTIAEACGWGYFKKTRTNRMIGKPISERGHLREVPDYRNDLNAMHEAEKVLNEDQKADFCGQLAQVIGAHWLSNNSFDQWLIAHATARQRAKAFLKTTGKWKV